jgi:hypothetical protein
MSSHEDSFQVPVPPAQAKALCAQAIASLGLTINGDTGYGFVCAEKFQFGLTWPVTMNVIVNYGDPGMSRITIGGSNFGFGPIQSSHVSSEVFALRRRIEHVVVDYLAHPQAASPEQSGVQTQPGSSASQPEPPPQPASGRQVFVNGVQLRDDKLKTLEQRYTTQIPDGAYWYDKMCGAWGMQGGPVLCTIEAHLNLGGPLQADASNGNTGVFINGRELHYLDIALLQRVVPMILPGRWWLDTYGNFGNEGGPMIGNLWAFAETQGGDRGSVLSSWDRTGAAVFSS